MSLRRTIARCLLVGWVWWSAGSAAQGSSPDSWIAPDRGAKTVGASGSQADSALKSAPGAAPAAPADSTAAPAAARGSANAGPITRPLVREGDGWLYRRQSGSTTVLMRQRVTALTEDGISLITEVAGSVDTATAVYDRQWGLLGSGYNTYTPALAYYAFPLYPGKRWRIDSRVNNFGADQSSRIEGEGSAAGFEEVETPAGRFFAMKVIVELDTIDPGDAARTLRVRETHWYAREILRPVKVESVTQVAEEAPRQETIELVRFRLD